VNARQREARIRNSQGQIELLQRAIDMLIDQIADLKAEADSRRQRLRVAK
jgi:hypothetical protein